MTYSANDARNDLHSDKKAEEISENYALIQQTTRAGGRWVHVCFGYNGIEAMQRIMKGSGYRTEITHGGSGLKVFW